MSIKMTVREYYMHHSSILLALNLSAGLNCDMTLENL